MMPMMDLPLPRSPSFSRNTLEANLPAVCTSSAAGRAWMPALFLIVTSCWVMSRSGLVEKDGPGALGLQPLHHIAGELLGRVVAHLLQPLVHGRGFDQDGDIAAGLDRDDQMGHLHPENVDEVLLGAGAVVG